MSDAVLDEARKRIRECPYRSSFGEWEKFLESSVWGDIQLLAKREIEAAEEALCNTDPFGEPAKIVACQAVKTAFEFLLSTPAMVLARLKQSVNDKENLSKLEKARAKQRPAA